LYGGSGVDVLVGVGVCVDGTGLGVVVGVGEMGVMEGIAVSVGRFNCRRFFSPEFICVDAGASIKGN